MKGEHHLCNRLCYENVVLMIRSDTTASRRGHMTVALCLLACALALCSAGLAHAGEPYGELLRFKGKGTNAGKTGSEFQFGGEETHAFAVDGSSGQVYVGSEAGLETEKLRVQSYSAAGAFAGEGVIKPPSLPSGISSLEPYEGFALAPSEKRIYVLATFKRFVEDPIDGNFDAAGALYALNSSPNASGKLEPAEGAGKEGILGNSESLGGNSNTQGKALLEPSGIAFDALSDEVLILGLVDEGGESLHVAVEHVSPSGTVLSTWVDPNVTTRNEEPDSPVVSPGGTLFFKSHDELFAIPASAKSGAPEVVFAFAEPTAFVGGPFAEELVSFGASEARDGGSLAIAPEGAAKGEFVLDAEVAEASELGVTGETRNAVLDLSYEEAAGHVSVAEQGWTGGIPGEGGGSEKQKACEIGFQTSYPQVAAGPTNVYVLSPAWGEVIEFGANGSGCPNAKAAATGLEVTLLGKPVSNPELSNTVTLQAKVVQANVTSVQWIFGDGQEATVPVQPGEQTQTAETTHKFAKTGKLKVEAVIHTDDLATPVLHVSTSVTVTGTAPGSPEITKQPTGLALLEGEAAHFEAGATGEPKPTVQWEVSSDGGREWRALAGQTGDALTIEGVTVAYNGDEYRATFTNAIGLVSSKPARLQVESLASREERKHAEEAERRKAEEEAARQQSEEAAARKAHEEAAAKRAQEEAVASARAAEEALARQHAEEQARQNVQTHGEGPAHVTLAGSSLGVKTSGAVTLRLGCPAGVKTCSGTISLRTLTAVTAGHGGHSAKKQVLTLARVAFTVPGGTVRTFTVQLGATARKLLAHSHSLRVKVTIEARNAAGQQQLVQSTATLRLLAKR
jgi:hypothetical protein